MASLTSASVTQVDAWSEGGTHGKKRSVIRFTFTTLGSPGNGSAANPIPAAAFGLTKITEVGPLFNTTDTQLVIGVPDATGANLLLFNMTVATDANRATSVDYISKAMQGTIIGY
jgi:hypothetical protein